MFDDLNLEHVISSFPHKKTSWRLENSQILRIIATFQDAAQRDRG